MLHLIFSLPHAWGGTTHSGTLPLLFDSRDFSVGSSLSPHNDFHFAPRSEIVALLRMMFLMLPPSHPRLDSYRECSVAVRHPLGHVLYFNKL